MDTIVLGGGVVGITTAWELAARGHDVTVVDSEPEAASATSHANGAQISPSESVPWASPHNLALALRWMRQPDGPFRLRLTADSRQWWWLSRFLRNCRQSIWDRNAVRMVNLALYSQARLAAIRDDVAIDYDREAHGILRVYRDERALQASLGVIDVMADLGVAMDRVDRDQISEIEPALVPAIRNGTIAGGILAAGDETGDARKFSSALAQELAARGVDFRWQTTVTRILTHNDAIHGVLTDRGRIGAERLVICAGLQSPALTRALGFDLPIYPLKGYSATRRLSSTNRAPRLSVTDENRRMVVSRLGDRIRAAGKADLVGHDRRLHPRRAQNLIDDLDALYPDLAYEGQPELWTGLRPMTPDGVPLIGTTPVKGLFLNTGHGSLGWTMAAGSAALVADVMDRRQPEIAAEDYQPRLV
ncbi:D-amino acid dehydrogenase [Minwuia sp.]|uniref:D-amino acid dehydrogenase n=1 Tax=Minwuia sp. TaxID=2493630 RepID=UPI003A94BAB6